MIISKETPFIVYRWSEETVKNDVPKDKQRSLSDFYQYMFSFAFATFVYANCLRLCYQNPLVYIDK